MRRLLAFVLIFLLFSLTACSDDSYTAESGTPAVQEDLLQGDAGIADAHDAEDIVEHEVKEKPDSPQEEVNPVYEEDAESIIADVTATNVYVLNVGTDAVLYNKNGKDRIAPASTAKMLTALTALDYCSASDVFKVGAEITMIAPDSSRAWLSQGDVLTVEQLLAALLLPSGNDAAYTLAVNTGRIIANDSGIDAMKAVEVFVDAMNRKAEEFGAVSSQFKNPDGYDEDGQYTTAFDLAQIAKACLNNDVLADIMGSYEISDTWVNGRKVIFTNTNELINPNSRYYYSKAVGLKTGSTEDAGSCLVSAAVINGQTYICVVMGSSSVIRFSDSLAVFRSIDPTIMLPQVNEAAPPLPLKANLESIPRIHAARPD